MNATQSVICGILRDKSCEPMSKLLAVKLAKDCIETFNDDYISQIQVTVLPVMEKLATLFCDRTDPNRGEFIFTD
jgi:hypothetical protein